MDIIVCLKQVVDLQQVRIKRETREPVTEGAPFVFGQFDKNALEEAVRLKTKHGGKITAVALGNPKLKDLILEALAIGADEALLLTDAAFAGGGSAGTAAVLAGVIRKLKFDLILMGEGSADNYSGQVAARLAELLDLPLVTYVRELSVDGVRLRATRDLEQSLQVVETGLPAIVTATSELNTPRLPPLTAILKASKKPVKTMTLADAGIAPPAPLVRTVSNVAPAQERKQVVLEGAAEQAVDDLIKALQREGVL